MTSFSFKFTVLGHYDSRLQGNEPHLTVNMLAGTDDRLTYCGTLTMSEAEWDHLRSALEKGLKEGLIVEDSASAGSR